MSSGGSGEVSERYLTLHGIISYFTNIYIKISYVKKLKGFNILH